MQARSVCADFPASIGYMSGNGWDQIMARKLPSTAFKPGQSGNPRGRPKRDAEVAEMARVHTAEALDTLAAVMRNTKAPASARVMAANAILDRGHGKAPRYVATERLDNMTDAELDKRLREAAADLRAMSLGHLFDEPGPDKAEEEPRMQ